MFLQTVILAAGKGTRMGELNLPKVLVSLKGKPLILHLLSEVEKLNHLTPPVLVVGYKKEMVIGLLGEHYAYAEQKELLGTAHALMAAREKIKAENVLVMYGDMPYIKSESLRKIINLHMEKKAKVSMLTTKVDEKTRHMQKHGAVVRNTEGKITKLVEYKDSTEAEKNILETNPGIYIFNTKWLWPNLAKIKNENVQHEYYLTDIINLAASEGLEVYSAHIPMEECVGVNSSEELILAEKML